MDSVNCIQINDEHNLFDNITLFVMYNKFSITISNLMQQNSDHSSTADPIIQSLYLLK